jgi:hypothetical protein
MCKEGYPFIVVFTHISVENVNYCDNLLTGKRVCNKNKNVLHGIHSLELLQEPKIQESIGATLR